MTVKEAAERMGTSETFLRLMLREGRFPFGTAIKVKSKWHYYISRERFELWEKGKI